MPLPAGVVSEPALAFTTTALAEIMTACFEGYVVPTSIDGDMFDARFRRETLDLRASRVFVDGGLPVALILVARRGWTARIAAMGIVPSHRSRGLGKAALSSVIDELHRLGDRRVLLEVIDTNEPAVRLYSSLGFRKRRRLVGYRRLPGTEHPSEAAGLVEIDPLQVAHRVLVDGDPNLPWLLAPETLTAMASPARGLSLANEAFAIVEPAPRPGNLTLRSLVVARHARGSGRGAAMIRALAATHPGHALLITANFPEEFVPGFLSRAGFERDPISQFEMDLDLAA